MWLDDYIYLDMVRMRLKVNGTLMEENIIGFRKVSTRNIICRGNKES